MINRTSVNISRSVNECLLCMPFSSLRLTVLVFAYLMTISTQCIYSELMVNIVTYCVKDREKGKMTPKDPNEEKSEQ